MCHTYLGGTFARRTPFTFLLSGVYFHILSNHYIFSHSEPHFLDPAPPLHRGPHWFVLQPHPAVILELFQASEDISIVNFSSRVRFSSCRDLGNLDMTNIGQVLLHVPSQVPLHLLQVEHVQLQANVWMV